MKGPERKTQQGWGPIPRLAREARAYYVFESLGRLRRSKGLALFFFVPGIGSSIGDEDREGDVEGAEKPSEGSSYT